MLREKRVVGVDLGGTTGLLLYKFLSPGGVPAISRQTTYFPVFAFFRRGAIAVCAVLCLCATMHAQVAGSASGRYIIPRGTAATQALPRTDTTAIRPDTTEAAIRPDTTKAAVRTDTTKAAVRTDTAKAAVRTDTTKTPASGIDSSVAYTAADSIVFFYSSKTMKMFGKCDVKYKTMALKSERIDVAWTEDRLEAYGVLDSAKAANPDSIKQRYIGMPEMVDGSEKYEGFRIAYNFKTQKGRITLGETAKDLGYYYGEHIKKVEPDMLFIADGTFTTCSLGHPHYFFRSPEMRVTVKDKIVARPIYLYIADVPLFALPFGVFPSQGGRRSGIIAPAYGDDGTYGRYVSHLGYYFALSDYYDLAVSGDWYTGGTWRARSHARYAKRYDFTGDINVEYSRSRTGEPIDADRIDEENYRGSIRHTQNFNPTTQLNVDFTFASNNSYRVTNDYSQRLQQQIYSNATFTKSWEGTNNLMSINIQRVQDLTNGSLTTTLPSINFSNSQIYPFRTAKKSRGLSSPGSESQYSWLEMIGISYNGQAMHNESKTRSAVTDTFTSTNRSGVNHQLGFSLAPKAGYFTVQPSFSYQERWYDKSRTFVRVDTGKKSIVYDDVKGFNALRTFSTGVSVSTKLYGMLRSPIPGLAGFRHTVTPALSYSYVPDFSKSLWGYWGRYRDSMNVEQKYDRFANGIFGGAPSGEQQAISLSVGNLFETKTAPKDTAVKEQKYQLLNLNASLGYNFAGEAHRLSDLNLSYRTSIGEYLSFSGNNTYSFYLYQKNIGRVNRFLLNNNRGLMQLTNFYVSLSTSLRGEKKRAETIEQKSDSARVEEKRRSLQSGFRTVYDDDIPDFSIPWNLAATFTFSQSQDNPDQKFRSANLGLNGGFNLTENWRFTASASYDVVTRQFAAPSINIYRDLHCWEMNFSWQPLGTMAGYRLEIRVKAPQLQDIKLTKQSHTSGYYSP